MVSVDELYAKADALGVSVYRASLPKTKSLSVSLPGGVCCIGIDARRMKTDAEHRERLAHEIGHCRTGAFYTPFSPVDNRRKCEETAYRAEIRELLPFPDLLQAMEDGDRTAWELAERFGVSEDLIRRACAYYVEACGKTFSAVSCQESV